MFKFIINIEGENISDIGAILNTVRKSILSGNICGKDSNDNGSYSFNSEKFKNETDLLDGWEKEETSGVCLYFKNFININGKKECVIVGNDQITVRENDECWEDEPLEYIDKANIYSSKRFPKDTLKEIESVYLKYIN